MNFFSFSPLPFLSQFNSFCCGKFFISFLKCIIVNATLFAMRLLSLHLFFFIGEGQWRSGGLWMLNRVLEEVYERAFTVIAVDWWRFSDFKVILEFRGLQNFGNSCRSLIEVGKDDWWFQRSFEIWIVKNKFQPLIRAVRLFLNDSTVKHFDSFSTILYLTFIQLS
jgi:hypothetical protein